MSRVKRGNVSREKHKKILKLAKGFRGRASTCYRQAHQAVLHALTHSYKDRRLKKRDFRALWITRINAALMDTDVSY
jgi:large subunit ribosomal protein L20